MQYCEIKLNKVTGKQAILRVLGFQDYDNWLTIEEISSQARGLGYRIGTSANSVGSRLPELARQGLVESSFRQGCNYKQWRLKKYGDIDFEP